MKPKALVLPSTKVIAKVATEEVVAFINEHYDAVWNNEPRELSGDELLPWIEETEVIFTGWGSPTLTHELLSKAKRLKAIAHSAGSVKSYLPPDVNELDVRIFSANKRLSHAVSEYCLGVMLCSLRHFHLFNEAAHNGGWKLQQSKGRELTGSTIGLISAGATAQGLIKLLQPFKCTIKVYDPYLSDEAASELGVRKVSLEEAMSCPIISIHAPKKPETNGMISRALLRRIPDGALLINSARAAVLDNDALLEQLLSKRFSAVLDVFLEEPLPVDHPLRSLDNVMLTPHIAGESEQGHQSLLKVVAEDVLKGLQGEPTEYEILPQQYKQLA